MNYRITKDSKQEELNSSITLSVKTKCPGKWILNDTETGETYRGFNHKNQTDTLHWKKIKDQKDPSQLKLKL